MQKSIEFSGKTVDDAVAKGLAQLALDRDDVSVEIVERGKTGFLGIGAVAAVVRISYEAPDEPAPVKKPAPAPEVKKETAPAPKAEPKKKPEQKKSEQKKPEQKKSEQKKPEQKKQPAEKAPEAAKAEPAPAKSKRSPEEQMAQTREFLSGLLQRMGVEAEIAVAPREGGGLSVELSGEHIGAVIGRRGETLDAIQHLTNYVVNSGSDKHAHISVDAENYRAKREESLVRLAEKMAEKAIRYKRGMALEPMNSYERHVIHAALQDYPGVTTSSIGSEPNRRVVVSYVPGEETTRETRDYKEWF